MDLLKAEIERKRKAVELAKKSADVGRIEARCGDDSRKEGRKFLRAADLRRFQERQDETEEHWRRKELHAAGNRVKDSGESLGQVAGKRIRMSTEKKNTHDGNIISRNEIEKGTVHEKDRHENENSSSQSADKSSRRDTKLTEQKLSPAEVTELLRGLGLPIRLFGERTVRLGKPTYDDSQRLERLNEARENQKMVMAGMSEMDEFRLGSGHGIRNPFLGGKKHGGEGEEDTATNAKKADIVSTGEADKQSSLKEETLENDDHDVDDPHKRIHRFFKKLLRQWEDDLAHRPDAVKRTAAGKNETKTLKQCKDYIRPLFKLCKSRRLEPSLMGHIIKIVDFCEQGEFVKAHDSYMDVAIGRAAWPIGVTMVGIHARSGRAKIESSNVAHVMNSELQRKYLTSVKRLMSYYQKKRTDVAPSKKVMNM